MSNEVVLCLCFRLGVVLRKPPWSLRDVLECYEKHWIAVFGQFFDRKLQTSVISLLKHFKQSTGYGTNIRQACCLLDDALCVVGELSVKKQYSDLTKEPRAIFSKLKDLGNKVLEGFKEIEDVPDLQVYLGKVPTITTQVQHHSPSLEGSMVSLDTEDLSSSTSTHTLYQHEADANLVKEKFQKSWEAIDNYCNEVQQMMQRGAMDEVYASVYEHLPVLSDLRKNFTSALNVKRRLIPQMNAHFAALCSSLDAIIPPDPTNNNDEKNLVDADKLARFFSKKDNRPLLTFGLKQLVDMVRSLFRCVQQA
ncbi:transcriptional protein SWT1-like [Liolophura sinensis]|uniref:transcriptional protein SWT1-like n=1 Tax=Liolophura sinensis TaxID=3198878 RepID=UPI0031590F28